MATATIDVLFLYGDTDSGWSAPNQQYVLPIFGLVVSDYTTLNIKLVAMYIFIDNIYLRTRDWKRQHFTMDCDIHSSPWLSTPSTGVNNRNTEIVS